MTYDLVIQNGTIITSADTYKADIAVNREKIVAIGQELKGTKVLDASDKFVTPGAVDIHVHLEMPIGDFVSADDFYTGTRAAAFGGTTTIVDFVERQPGQTMIQAIEERRALADSKVVLDYGLHMTLGPNEIEILDQVPAAFDAGCISFKMYMAYALCLTDSQMMQALEAVRDVAGLAVIHAENWDIITTLIKRNLASGNTSPRWHPRSRPASMEGEATGRVIDIADLVGAKLHIFHVTSPQAVERIVAARERGQPVSAETCPQYLLLTSEVFDRPGVAGALPICSPPIRDKATQELLWKALHNGSLQLISTDHCPFSSEDKATGLDDYSRVPGGVPSIEMRFPALYHFGVRSGHITLNQWVDLCCTTPARLTGFEEKGDIKIGKDADLVVFDPNRQIELSTKTLHENVDWTPYEGLELTGWPSTTLSRGEIIVNDGVFQGLPGRGRYLRRRFSA